MRIRDLDNLHYIDRISNNFSRDELLSIESKALLLCSYYEESNLKNIYVFDGIESLFLFIDAAKAFADDESQPFAFSFVLTVGGRAHDISGNMCILNSKKLDYAIIIDPNIDDAALVLVAEYISSKFEMINHSIIINGLDSKNKKLRGTMPQQKYGFFCSVYSLSFVMLYASYDAKNLYKKFSVRAELKNNFNSVMILQEQGLPVEFAYHAQDPSEFLDKNKRSSSEIADLELFYRKINYALRRTYSKGPQMVSTSIETLKKSYQDRLISSESGYLRGVSNEQYLKIFHEYAGYNFLRRCSSLVKFMADKITISYTSLPDELIFQLLSNKTIASYRLGDIAKYYDLKDRINANPDIDDSEKIVKMKAMYENTFAICRGKFNNHLFFKNVRENSNCSMSGNSEEVDESNTLGKGRVLISKNWIEFPECFSISCDSASKQLDSSFSSKNSFGFFSNYDDIHSLNPIDPCPASIEIKTQRSELQKWVLSYLDMVCIRPYEVLEKGGNNLLALYGLFCYLQTELDNNKKIQSISTESSPLLNMQ